MARIGSNLSLHMIRIIPLGSINRWYLPLIAESLEEQFECKVRLSIGCGLPKAAFDPIRQQYNSTVILQMLSGCAPGDPSKLLGVTNVDLFSPIFSFVFGEARLGGRCAVISSYRLHAPSRVVHSPPVGNLLFVSRIEKEAIHELGHCFGLHHCLDPDCVMHFSSRLDSSDRKFPFFCAVCRELLFSGRRNPS